MQTTVKKFFQELSNRHLYGTLNRWSAFTYKIGKTNTFLKKEQIQRLSVLNPKNFIQNRKLAPFRTFETNKDFWKKFDVKRIIFKNCWLGWRQQYVRHPPPPLPPHFGWRHLRHSPEFMVLIFVNFGPMTLKKKSQVLEYDPDVDKKIHGHTLFYTYGIFYIEKKVFCFLT